MERGKGINVLTLKFINDNVKGLLIGMISFIELGILILNMKAFFLGSFA